MSGKITKVEIRDAREMITTDEVEIFLDMTYQTGRTVSIGFTEGGKEQLQERLADIDRGTEAE